MKLLPLQQVSSQLRAGVALPWGVRDAEGKLLLARGHIVASDQTLAALLERGVYVDADEMKAAAPAMPGPSENYFSRWAALNARLTATLRHPEQDGLLERVRDCIGPIVSLVERNADLMIFLVLRHDYTRSAYGVAHSLHVAAVCSLLARRLQWPAARHEAVLGAALTMNLSMVDLQGRLAAQTEPLSATQRDAVHAHPLASAALLRAAGLDDDDWLRAVEQHHELPGGGGYPGATDAPTELAQMLRFVDGFTAMHSARAGRGALPAQQVARHLYMQSAGNPLAALLIKEFGIYPPGCYVRLASGETAVVVRRGADAARPIVAVLLNRAGDPLAAPARRDTADAAFAIAETVPASAVRLRVPAEAFFAGELAH